MNRKLLFAAPALLVYVLASFLTSCSSNNNNNSNHTPASIAVASGSGQSATVSTAFSTPLVATVTDSSGSPVSGASVTFTVVAGSTGASGSFATGGATDTETTGSNGQATTSQMLTANGTAGAFTVTAAVSGVTTPATFTFTNTSATANTTTYVFYAGGAEAPNTGNGDLESYYAVAGAVAIDANGNVVGGEEDYNDASGITQGGTTPVSITSGTLTVDATGQGTLTLVTGNQFLGVAGTETLGVQFANTSHALIIQFDGSATSSGSLDQQTATSGGGNFAFVLSGVDWEYGPVGYGGVYSVSSNSITGIADVNDDGVPVTANTFTGSSTSTDSYGRGSATVAINSTTLTLYYYTVGAEVIRLIDMDPGGVDGDGGAAVGSAYGQGSTTTFSASSLGSSTGNAVLGLQADPWGYPYATAGSIIATPVSGTSTGTFTGTVDDNEDGATAAGQPFAGTYSVSNNSTNGYSNLTVTNTNPPSPFFHVTNLGVYMTDPTLNLLDPNNTAGPGGALVLDLDPDLSGGTGLVIPQTDFTTADFSGNYAFGAQEYFSFQGNINEFDYLGQGSISSLALTGTGLVSDPFAFFAANGALYSATAMSGTAAADTNEATNGRYTMPFVVDAVTNSPSDDLSLAIYQASGGTLLFMESSPSLGSLGFGSFQQQGSLTGLPAKRSPVKKAQKTIKH